MTKHIITATITSVALAAVCACNKDNRDNSTNTPPSNNTPITRNAPAERQDVNAPMTVTGCLQKKSGLGTTYIVTAMNEPSQKNVGTSGNAAAVEREQLREAANSYRVEAKDKVDMDAMVGKEVRVSGVMAKRADLPEAPAATAGRDQSKPMEKIDNGDLAKIDDATIEVVSDNCGGHDEKSSAPKAGKQSR